MLSFLIKRPVAVGMTIFTLSLLGMVSFLKTPISILPEIEIPRISIVLEFENSDHSDMANVLVEPMISKLSQANGLEDITAMLDDQKVKFDLTFAFGTDMDYAYLEVTDLSDVILKDNPYRYNRPAIFRHNLSDLPILFIHLSSQQSSNSIEFSKLSDFAYNSLKRRLEQLPEVAFVDIAGGQFEEITITPKMETLASLKVGESAIYDALDRQNLDFKTYSIKNGNYFRTLRVNSKITSLEDLQNIAIQIGSRIFKLRELAEVSVRLKSNNGQIYSNGNRAVTLAIIKSGSSRIDELKAQIDQVIGDTQSQFPNLQFHLTRDQSQLLNNALGSLKMSLILGILFAGLVVYFLNRNTYHTLIILLNVPVALAITFLFFELFGLTINIITLSGLTICVGLMIDNTIIVLDNIVRKQSHQDLLLATETGTLDVVRPLLTSLLTTCSLFFPLIFLSGLAGALFYDQAMTISVGLMVSFLIAITFLPTTYVFLRNRHSTYSKGRDYLLAKYHQTLSFTYQNSRITLLGFLAFLMVSVLFFWDLPIKKFPKISEDYTVMALQWEEFYSTEQIQGQIQKFHEAFQEQLVTFHAYIGPNDFLLDESKDLKTNESKIIFKPITETPYQELKEQMQAYLSHYHPYTTYDIHQSKTSISYVFSTDEESDIILYQRQAIGDQSASEKIIAAIEEINSEIEAQRTVSREKMFINYDDQKLIQYNVDPTSLSNRIRLLLDQLRPKSINSGDLQESVRIISGSDELEQLLGTAQIINQDSVFIPLRNLISVKFRRVPNKRFFDQKGEFETLELKNMKEDQANELKKRFNREFRNEWLAYDRQSSRLFDFLNELILVFAMSIALLYFILAIQFESLIQPLIVLSEIPIGLSGGLWLLLLAGGTLNVMAGIGLIFLAGIMINDSILKIEQINRLKVSFSLDESIKTAGKFRFNAIVSTSFTTIASLIPIIVLGSQGSELQRPLALVLVGGMITSTIASLYLIPTIYKLIYNRKPHNL
ncbi:MAG: efflux RND transporter permease subunit [Cytophagales bacterium]|nr:efflux RND transporter permease subunit [Cytophagales bacterium]